MRNLQRFFFCLFFTRLNSHIFYSVREVLSHSINIHPSCPNMPFFFFVIDKTLCHVFYTSWELSLCHSMTVVFSVKISCGAWTSLISVCVQISCIQNKIIYSFLIPCMFNASLFLLNGLRKGLLVVKNPAGMRWMILRFS